MRTLHWLTIVVAWIATAQQVMAGAGPRAEARSQALNARAASALLNSLPLPVRRTILIEFTGGTLNDVTRTNADNGDVIYDVDFTRAGRSHNMTVALDGRLLDIQVYPSETPLVVSLALGKLSQGGHLGDITKNIGLNGDCNYDADITRDGVTRTYTVDDDGELQDMQVFLPETPPAVQKTINATVAAGVLNDITRDTDDDGTSYEVSMNLGGTNRTFSVSTNGEILEAQVFMNEVPEAMQKAIHSQAKRGRFGKINKSTDEGEDYYEIEISLGLNTVRVTFKAAGAFDSEEEDMTLASLPARVKIALHPLQVAGEQVNEVTRYLEGTNTTYDIELHKEKAHRTLTFDPNGNIVPP